MRKTAVSAAITVILAFAVTEARAADTIRILTPTWLTPTWPTPTSTSPARGQPTLPAIFPSG